MKIQFSMLILLAVCACERKQKVATEDQQVQVVEEIKPATLDGTWELSAINDTLLVDYKDYVLMQSHPQLTFDTSKYLMGGYGGCNEFAGTATFTDDKITLGEEGLFTNELSCNNDDFEKRLYNLLHQIDRYTITGDTLSLIISDGATLTYIKM